MSDASLVWRGDLSANPVGDIATCSHSELSQQRLLRRLLTNAGDYLWYPEYGAGLAQFIGLPCDTSAIKARIRSQIFADGTILTTPEPIIDVQNSADGSIYVQIRYIEMDSGVVQTVSFAVSV